MAPMNSVLENDWLSLKGLSGPIDDRGEHLCFDNPYAHSVAGGLFDAKVRVLGSVCRQGYQTKPQAFKHHYLRVLLQGQLKGRIKGKNFELQPGDLLYYPPQTEVEFCCDPEDLSWFLYVTLEDTPNWEGLKINGSYIEAYESTPLMFILIRRMIDAHKSRHINSLKMVEGDGESLLNLLRGLIQRKEKDEPRLNDLKLLVKDIHERPQIDWSQGKMIKRMSVSPRTLLRLFKKEYGCSPLEMVTQIRLNHGMELLQQSDASIETIALKCGYDNSTSFSRTFRRYINTSPGLYRKEYKNIESFDFNNQEKL